MLFSSRREQRQLAEGKTYEPKTFIEAQKLDGSKRRMLRLKSPICSRTHLHDAGAGTSARAHLRSAPVGV